MSDMRLEANRLNTFANWSSNPIDPERIAKGGFFATGNGTEVQCCFCLKFIAEWHYGDQVMARHRRLNPLCPFVINPSTSGNVPNNPSPPAAQQQQEQPDQLQHPTEAVGESTLTQPTPAQTASVDEVAVEADEVDLPQASTFNGADHPAPQDVSMLNMLNEQSRLATFKYWPVPFIAPQALARAGFFYFNQGDRVKCAYCNGVIEKWERGDDPFDEHRRFFSHCSRVQGNPPRDPRSGTASAHTDTTSRTDESTNNTNDEAQPPLFMLRGAKKPKFSTIEARLRTFFTWPRSDIQEPLVLATSGFYYEEIDDQVRCFHCCGGLRAWQKEDNAWFEHAKWFPRCAFVNRVKGTAFVQSVQQQIGPPTNRSDQQTNNHVDTAALDEAMQSEPVSTALLMGLHEGRVRAVTQRHIQQMGVPYWSIDRLIEDVLEGQHDEENGETEEEAEPSSNIVREVSRILNNIFSTATPNSENNNEESASGYTPDSDEMDETPPSQLGQQTIERSSVPELPTPTLTRAAAGASTQLNPTDYNHEVPSTSSRARMQPPVVIQSLEEENRQLKDARLCKICMDNEVAAVYLPCGHIVTCLLCAPIFKTCPLCRATIKGIVRTFLP